MGRPSEFTQEIADAIFLRLAGGESLRKICDDADMPSRETVRLWCIKPPTPEFLGQYTRAREAQAEFYADEILEIADESSGDYKTVETDGGAVEVVDHEHIQRSRLRVDARKWAASKLAPKKYGDRVLNEHSGPSGGPIPLEHSAKTPDQVRDELADIFGAGDTAPAAAAAPDVVAAAAEPAGSDPVVHREADQGGNGEPGPSVPGAEMAGEERSFLPFDDNMSPEGP